MDYGDLLRRSWEIVRNHRYLWLLALFAGESGGAYSFNGNFGNLGSRGGGRGGGSQPPNLQPVVDWVGAHVALIAAAGLVLVVVWIALFLLSCACASALVRAADRLDRGEEVGLGAAWRLGLERFGGVLRLRLLLLLYGLVVLAVAGLLLGAAVLAGLEQQWAALLLAGYVGIGVLAVVGITGIVLPTLMRLALRAIVLDGLGAVAGVRTAIALVRRRSGPVLVLFAIELAIALAVAIVIVLALAVAVGPAIVVGLAAHSVVAGVVVVVVLLAVVLVITVVVAAGVSAFLSTLWTLGYRRLRPA